MNPFLGTSAELASASTGQGSVWGLPPSTSAPLAGLPPPPASPLPSHLSWLTSFGGPHLHLQHHHQRQQQQRHHVQLPLGPADVSAEALAAAAAVQLFSHGHHLEQLQRQLQPQAQAIFPSGTVRYPQQNEQQRIQPSPSPSPNLAPQPAPGTPYSTSGGSTTLSASSSSASSPPKVMLQIGVQPPSRTVYQRLLKPYPSVYFIVPPACAFPSEHGYHQGGALHRLRSALDGVGVYIEASVVRIDTGDTLDRSIDGITSVRLEKSDWHSGVYTATFKKLKLLTTSQQRSGTKFSLCFRLTCGSGDLDTSLANLSVTSSPVEVFSHSLYLSQAEEDGGRKREAPVPKNAIARKYGSSCAGLQLKIMEMMHAFKELGGTEQAMHESVSSIYSPHGDAELNLFTAAETNARNRSRPRSAQASPQERSPADPQSSPPSSGSSSLQHLLNPAQPHQPQDQLNGWLRDALSSSGMRTPKTERGDCTSPVSQPTEPRSFTARRRRGNGTSPASPSSQRLQLPSVLSWTGTMPTPRDGRPLSSASAQPPSDPSASVSPASRLPSIASLLHEIAPSLASAEQAGRSRKRSAATQANECRGDEEEEEEEEDETKSALHYHRHRRRRQSASTQRGKGDRQSR